MVITQIRKSEVTRLATDSESFGRRKQTLHIGIVVGSITRPLLHARVG